MNRHYCTDCLCTLPDECVDRGVCDACASAPIVCACKDSGVSVDKLGTGFGGYGRTILIVGIVVGIVAAALIL